jgi:hypothetical protein
MDSWGLSMPPLLKVMESLPPEILPATILGERECGDLCTDLIGSKSDTDISTHIHWLKPVKESCSTSKGVGTHDHMCTSKNDNTKYE